MSMAPIKKSSFTSNCADELIKAGLFITPSYGVTAANDADSMEPNKSDAVDANDADSTEPSTLAPTTYDAVSDVTVASASTACETETTPVSPTPSPINEPITEPVNEPETPSKSNCEIEAVECNVPLIIREPVENISVSAILNYTSFNP